MRFFSPTSARVPGWGGTAAAFITHPQNRPSITNGGMTKKEAGGVSPFSQRSAMLQQFLRIALFYVRLSQEGCAVSRGHGGDGQSWTGMGVSKPSLCPAPRWDRTDPGSSHPPSHGCCSPSPRAR